MEKGKEKKMKAGWIAKLILVLISFSISLVIAEFGARAYIYFTRVKVEPSIIPGVPYQNVLSAEYYYRGNNYRINNYGCRGKDFPADKPEGERRIVFVGDSVFFGAFTEEEGTIEARLQKILDQERSEENWNVLNCATSSYGLWGYEAYFRSVANWFEPDVVVVGITLNDSFKHTKEEKDNWLPQRPERVHWRGILRQSSLVQFLGLWPIHKCNPITGEDVKELERIVPYEGAQAAVLNYAEERDFTLYPALLNALEIGRNPERWKRAAEPLQGLCDFAKLHKVPVLFVISPIECQLWEGYDDPEPQATIREMIEEEGFPVLDLLESFQSAQRQKGPEERLIDPELYLMGPRPGDFIHYRGRGNQLAAEEIYENLENQGLLNSGNVEVEEEIGINLDNIP